MTSLDVLFIAVAAGFALRGIWTGVVSQASFLAALAAGFFAAARLHARVSPYLAGVAARPEVRFIITCGFLFVTAYLLVRLAGLLVRKAVRVGLLAGLDRGLGGLFGLVKGLAVDVIIFTCLAALLSSSAPFLKRSVFYPWLLAASQASLALARDPGLRRRFLPREPAIPEGFGEYLKKGGRTQRDLETLRYRLEREAGRAPRR